MMKKNKRFGMRKRDLLIELMIRDGDICYLCKQSLYEEWKRYREYIEKGIGKRTKINLNVDHVNPFSKSKDNSLANLRLTHITCNTKKGDTLV